MTTANRQDADSAVPYQTAHLINPDSILLKFISDRHRPDKNPVETIVYTDFFYVCPEATKSLAYLL